MPHTLPPSWSEVNVPVDIGSLERWQDTHRSYTYHLQLMKYPVTRGRKICLASSRDVLCYCSVESWKWRILCLIPCCWSPLKRDCFFMCNVRIWSWTCQKHEKKKTAPRHNCQPTWAHFLRIRLSHHFTYFKKSLDSTCCNLGLHRPASRQGQGTQPRVKSPPLERLKWCFMLCV